MKQRKSFGKFNGDRRTYDLRTSMREEDAFAGAGEEGKPRQHPRENSGQEDTRKGTSYLLSSSLSPSSNSPPHTCPSFLFSPCLSYPPAPLSFPTQSSFLFSTLPILFPFLISSLLTFLPSLLILLESSLRRQPLSSSPSHFI